MRRKFHLCSSRAPVSNDTGAWYGQDINSPLISHNRSWRWWQEYNLLRTNKLRSGSDHQELESVPVQRRQGFKMSVACCRMQPEDDPPAAVVVVAVIAGKQGSVSERRPASWLACSWPDLPGPPMPRGPSGQTAPPQGGATPKRAAVRLWHIIHLRIWYRFSVPPLPVGAKSVWSSQPHYSHGRG